MAILAKMLDAISEAGRTPLSLVAFLAVAGIVLVLGVRSHRLSVIRKALRDLPEADRQRALEIVIGQPLPPGMTPEQWLKYQRQKILFHGFIAILVFTAIIYAIFVYAKPGDDDERDAVEKRARQALTYFYSRDKDSQQFDLWLDTIKQQYGSLSSFRSALDKNRAQLIETPVQRRKISVDATQAQAVALFDGETDSGMTWRERVDLQKIGAEWKVSGLIVTPLEWVTLTGGYAPASLSGFIAAVKAGEGATGAIPAPGWNVRIVGRPVPVENGSRLCDVVVSSGTSKATMRHVYGSCGLADGASVMIMGIATMEGEDVSLSKVRFAPQ